MKDDPVQVYLELPHRSTCSYWEFSGDRHCSCGKEEAEKRYNLLMKAIGLPVNKRKELTIKMKVIMIGGYPGSGKSTIMRGVIEKLEQAGQTFKVQSKGSVRYMNSKDFIILGEYASGEKFPGTDRYPMNIQPAAEHFLAETKTMNPNKVVLLEGDRLFNDKMIRFLKDKEFDLVLCIIKLEYRKLVERRNKRSEQNESWRKGRESKVDRMSLMYPVTYYLENNSKKDMEQAVEVLIRECMEKDKPVQKVDTKLKQLWK